jgi:transcriptional regulator with XRE-family HTH domain
MEKMEMNARAIQKDFGRAIREIRRMQRITQLELGKKARIHWTYIGGIEQGRRNPTLLMIHKLARGLDMPASKLLELVGIMARREE